MISGDGGIPWLPTELGVKLLAWYDPSDDEHLTIDGGSGEVQQLLDQSGGNNDSILRFTGANTYLSKTTMGGQQALLQNTTEANAYMYLAPTSLSFGNGDIKDVFSVIETSDTTFIMGNGNSATRFFGAAQDGSTSSPTGLSGTPTYWGDGVSLGSTRDDLHTSWSQGKPVIAAATNLTLDTDWLNAFYLWWYSSGVFQLDGVYGDYIICGTLTADERQQLEGYLAHKYGVESNLPVNHPYRNSAPTVVE